MGYCGLFVPFSSRSNFRLWVWHVVWSPAGPGLLGVTWSNGCWSWGTRCGILDDLSTGGRVNIERVSAHPQCELHVGSITDPVVLAEVMRGIDVVYHLAAAVGVKLVADDPVRTIETNIYPTELLLRLAVQGKQRVFLASTSEVYGKNPKERWTEEDDLFSGSHVAAAVGLWVLEGHR